MKFLKSLLAAAFLLVAGQNVSKAVEFDYLQTDPRFTGGEFNVNDPTHPNFWFYDQYTPARNALQTTGIRLTPITNITLPNLVRLSDMFYIPSPTNPSASVYPLTDAELDVLDAYTADSQFTGGRSVIFNLTGASAAMTNNLLARLGFDGHMAGGTITGNTSYPLINHPVVKGPIAQLGSFTMTNTGYFDSLGTMRSLVDINGKSVVPYVEKGDLTRTSGAYFFLLDDKLLSNWNGQSNNAKNFWLNLVEYAAQDQFLHYSPPVQSNVAVPEPASLAVLGMGVIGLLARRRRN